eukprot:9143421-Lingulodinium_polyedra.AAC.1
MDCRLQLAYMKVESLVIAGQLYCGESVPGPCTHRPSHHGSWLYPKIYNNIEGRIGDWGEVLSWLEHTPDKGKVPGSSLGWPKWGYSSVGRALLLHSRCQRSDEGRDYRRNDSGSRKYAVIRMSPNEATQ